jgi:hypothetical protein
MASDHPLDRLIAAFDPNVFQRALLEAYNLGKDDGAAEVRANLMKVLAPDNLQVTTPAQNRAEMEPRPSEGAEDSEGSAPRAPRGLTREVVSLILETEPGLLMPEIQKKAVEIDARVSGKTVYNEINREKGKLYQQHLGRWRLITPHEEGDSGWLAQLEGQSVSG